MVGKNFAVPGCLGITLLLSTLSFSQEPHGEAEVSSTLVVDRILEKAAVEIRKNRETFDGANKPPVEVAKQELQAFAKRLIEQGRTKEAAAVLKHVETLHVDVMELAGEPPPLGNRAAVRKRLQERLAGEWTFPTSEFVFCFRPDGSYYEYRKSNRKTHARGRVQIVTESVADVQVENGWKMEIRPAGDDACAVLPTDPSGNRMQGVVWERVR